MVEEKVLTAAREYAAAVRKTMNVRDIFLYGSPARGEAKKDSDINVAVLFCLPPGMGAVKEDIAHIHRFPHGGSIGGQHFFFNHKYSASVS